MAYLLMNGVMLEHEDNWMLALMIRPKWAANRRVQPTALSDVMYRRLNRVPPAGRKGLTTMIAWSSSIHIRRPPDAVFELLANIQNVQQSEGSPVLALDLATAGPPRLGSKYREVVQMTPFFKGEFLSEITAFDPPRVLEMTWTGPGMTGTDRYEFTQIRDGTKLTHGKWVWCPGVLRVLEPIMRVPLVRRLEQRLVAIKRLLEEGANS